MASILLIGPGAIGATLAAWLAQDDRHDVAVAARTPFDSIEVQTPEGVIRAKPRVYTEFSQVRPVDWVLVATKAYDSDAAAQWFPTACGPRTRAGRDPERRRARRKRFRNTSSPRASCR